jgi:hypothetical protein
MPLGERSGGLCRGPPSGAAHGQKDPERAPPIRLALDCDVPTQDRDNFRAGWTGPALSPRSPAWGGRTDKLAQTRNDYFGVFDLALPDNQTIPAKFMKFPVVSLIAEQVSVKLLLPEVFTRLWVNSS